MSELKALSRTETVHLVRTNELFWLWLKHHYNDKRHSATKQAPSVRFDLDGHPIRKADLSELYEAFLLEETRKVDKTGLFSLMGKTYETCPELSGKTVTVRFDPYDATKVKVFFEGKSYGEAKPFDMPRPCAWQSVAAREPANTPNTTGLNLLTIAPKEGISYKDLLGGK